ncbi:MAG: 4Fe-4S binding protein [Planctomycetota bacterium]|jgi:ferredoxin
MPSSKGKSRWWKRADAVFSRLAPTWRASPVRRLIQAAFLGLFGYLFFYVSWPYAQVFSSRVLSDKQWLPAELLLWMDPLVGLSTSIAARAVSLALVGAAAILLVCLFIPRAFCGYVCPLGTLIDLFDGLIFRPAGWLGSLLTTKTKPIRGRKVSLSQGAGGPLGQTPAARNPVFQPERGSGGGGWWVHLKYYVLAGVLTAAVFGVLLSGFVSAIAVLARGAAFTLGRLQLGWLRNWGQVKPLGWAEWLSIGLFALILLAGVFRRRFWCRYVCPSGAVFSLASVFRLTERKVRATCIDCGKCVEICPLDAIDGDYHTRTRDCTWCRTCGGVCPVGAITFVGRSGGEDLKARRQEADEGRHDSRRGFLLAAAGGAAAAMGIRQAMADGSRGSPLVRPPGSVPEPEFLDLCVRCGQCFQACPGPVLHPAGWEARLEALWTPVAVLTHAGCHQDCNFCTQVCPTGAIRPLTLDQKRKTSMGLAVIDRQTCLPHAGRQDCRRCVDECDAAGYRAIDVRRIELPLPDVPEGVFSEFELDQMRHIDAPFVNREACVGCGLCEYRCHAALVRQEGLLEKRAVRVVAENTDR